MNVLHLYWGRSRPLSWLRLQTAVTFKKHNPDWEIKVWYRESEPKAPYWDTPEQKTPYQGGDFFVGLEDVATVAEAPVAMDLPDVPFSDYLRLWLLGNVGGFWSDFDIVYTDSMDRLPQVDGPFLIRYPSGIWPVGFMGAQNEKGRRFFRAMEGAAKQRVTKARGYQTIGCELLGDYADGIKEQDLWVYPEWKLRPARSAYFTPYNKWACPSRCIGFHWYGGADFAAEVENAPMSGDVLQTGIMKALL